MFECKKKDQRAFRPSQAVRPTGLLLILLALLLPGSSRMAWAQAGEEEIKAAFLFNFARYVQWPEGSFDDRGTPVRVCVLGADDFARIVSANVSGKSVDDRSVEVVDLKDPASLGGCHILFVGDETGTSRRALLGEIGKRPVLTVSDSEGFAREGGIANFYRDDNKVRFEINPGAARVAGLKISSQLLRLAKVVE